MVHNAKKEGRHRNNTYTTRKPEKVKEIIRVLEEVLPCPANTSAIYKAASLTFGKTGKDSGLV